ncbi:glycerol-3-phosphate dehydrogenase subunit GlpB [Chloroflexia bacterium SDU3-3]|nr:glycerol-3-phosphate dehydrogenase subunit GlpB [Chloroflexia bacterium SDU3-3]
MRDTIVIGAGLSGLMAALQLAEAGRRPLVLAKGQGATHWTPGTIDIWGAVGDQTLREALEALIAGRPEHPYARVGVAQVESAIERFRALVEAARYPYVGGLDRNVLLPTAIGALRPAALFPATMAAGDMRQGGKTLIAGFRQLRDFFPPMIAANLREQGHDAQGVYLDLPASTGRTLDFNTRSFALLFDRPEWRAQIGQQLRKLKGDATRIGLPAVLGLHDPMAVVADLQREAGALIFEIPTVPASVPGMRLAEIFARAITAAGGRMQLGAFVERAEGEGQQLRHIYSEAAARQQQHSAQQFVLATGGVGGGGVWSDPEGKVWERALGLPILAPQGRGQWFSPRFLDPTGHPIFQAGVAVDTRFRPIDGGQVVYENVAVAGAALAGADPVRERCYSGLALATGYAAAQSLL